LPFTSLKEVMKAKLLFREAQAPLLPRSAKGVET
jgi:hypothetical protein